MHALGDGDPRRGAGRRCRRRSARRLIDLLLHMRANLSERTPAPRGAPGPPRTRTRPRTRAPTMPRHDGQRLARRGAHRPRAPAAAVLLLALGPLVLIGGARLFLSHRRPLRLDRRRLCPGQQGADQQRRRRPRRRGRGRTTIRRCARASAVRARRQPYRIALEHAEAQLAAARCRSRRCARHIARRHRRLARPGHARPIPAARIRPPAARWPRST